MVSKPSTVLPEKLKTPALFTKTSSLPYRFRTSAASVLTSAREDRSQSSRSTESFPDSFEISRLAASPLLLLRQTITTFAFMPASERAVSLPIPEFAPVTMQVLPSSMQGAREPPSL